MGNRPHFLDEEPPPPPVTETAAQSTSPPPADLPTGPVLFDTEPGAPTTLQVVWRPQDLATSPTSAGTLSWTVLGIVTVLVSLVMLSVIAFVLDMTKRSAVLGVASGVALGMGLGLIGYAIYREWRSYRRLKTVDHTRLALSGHGLSVEALRFAALAWLEQVSARLPEATEAIRAVRSAPTSIEIQSILRNRAADPLRQAAKTIGQRAALQAASLIAISPHASWDGLIAGVRGVLIIRAVARLFGLQPGLAMTVVLVRKVAWTVAGTAGIDLLSQSLADHALNSLPIAKHIAAAVPGSGVAAMRLYRLASIAAEAYCPNLMMAGHIKR